MVLYCVILLYIVTLYHTLHVLHIVPSINGLSTTQFSKKQSKKESYKSIIRNYIKKINNLKVVHKKDKKEKERKRIL